MNTDPTNPQSPDDIERLESANRLKAELIANVSHELRTPVHAIIGYVELLLEGIYGPLTDEQEESLQFVCQSANDLLNLITNLLDTARLESGKSDLILSSFDLRDLISEVLGQLRPLALAKAIDLQSGIFVDSTVIRTDRGKLKQVLINLLSNALKFTHTGKITIAVSPAESPQVGLHTSHKDRLQVCVRDTGVGIPTDKLSRIFDKFYQVDGSASRAHEGTGLGLYITKQLLELLEATIEVVSTVGQGTAVTINLPRSFEEIASIHRLRKRIAAVEAAAPGEGSDSTRLVMVISDNPDVGRILADGLGSADYKVQVVPAGTETAAVARRLRPLVILLNSEAISSDFWLVFQELKLHPDTKDIPTIFLGDDSAHGLGAPVPVAATLNRQEILRSIRAATVTGHKNILIVDDEESFREILKLVLTEEGYCVTEASDGQEALAKLSANKPDLLLLDLNIPEVSGWEIVRRISLDPELKDVEVLIISGAVLDENETKALHAGTRGIISKADFKVDNVLERVADLLEVK